ncbi:hypothetical protein [Macrococcus lamae]|uniref:Uncharacterized protein n=1 Tax=Macrococcus lamae TaxID=198484 RepID=A0A4R6BV56_9STAP|nr:hypothetical protein [Macrococcus lamae]TDM12064.1 hypothetical protein ERX29_04400 [Macrococcus lamae]
MTIFYFTLIIANLVLITILLIQPLEGWSHKLLQVLIVIITFTLFRTYVKERQFIGKNKKDGERS